MPQKRKDLYLSAINSTWYNNKMQQFKNLI